jgi:hypothetical protein
MWIAAAITTPAAALAAPSTTYCNGTLAPGGYGKVIVPQGAVCTSDGPVRIRGGLRVDPGATFVLGSEEAPGDNGTINGVTARHAASVQIHFVTINGGVVSHGGSGPFGPPFDVTWTTIEDSTINGNVLIDGYDGFWMGFFRNHVFGNVTMTNNVLQDEDGNEYANNVIDGNLNCAGNDPAPQFGDSGGTPNTVTGQKTGQCTAV